MSIIERLTSIFLDDITLAVLSYIGLILSIKVNHKKIKYVVATKNDEYIIAFWNSCRQTIFSEDIFKFSIFAKSNSICETVYSTDPAVKPYFSISENETTIIKDMNVRFNTLVKEIKCTFDFLNKRQGYIIYIKNSCRSDQVPSRIAFSARIRGESKNSVQCISIFPKNVCGILGNNFMYIAIYMLQGIFVSLQLFCIVQAVKENMAIAFTLLGSFLCLILYYWYINKPPFTIKKIYSEYIKSGYTELPPNSVEI